MDVIVRFLHAFGHIVYIAFLLVTSPHSYSSAGLYGFILNKSPKT